MPAFVLWILAALAGYAGELVGRVLISLGIGYVTYTGVDTGIDWAKTKFLEGISGLPADAIGMAGQLGIGICVSMILSAVTARLTLAGLTSGTIKRMVSK